MKIHSHVIVLVTCGLMTANAQAKKPVCGDGRATAAEQCDGDDLLGQTCQGLGYDGGTLACNPNCTLDESGCFYTGPTCGDGVAEGTENCDGADLGGETCQGLGYDGGTLACHGDCTFDTGSCTSGGGGSCGDDAVQGYEECDGTADSACPGLCSAHCACPATSSRSLLEVHVIDVGQGDAVVVVSPDGFVMLVDSGEESRAQVVADYLTAQGITGIDYTLVSHMHTDHLGAMDILLGWYPDVVVSFDHGGDATSVDFNEYLAAADTRRSTLLTGQAIDMGAGVQADVLHAHEGASLENNNSLVIRLTFGGNTFLLGGDCQSGCENDLTTGPIQIYKVHHHGSPDASTDGLLTQMQPELALISVGEGNPYDHPDTNTVNRLTGYGADVHRTDLEGHLAVYADGVGYSLNTPPGCQNGEDRPCGSSDVGACQFGTQTCTGGAWGDCEGAVEPVAEDCGNGIDDDCDGATDQADPDCGAPAAQVVIAQVGYDTPGTDSIEEFVDLYNPTGADVPLDDWTLADNLGSWTIPSGTTIQSGAYLSIARDGNGFEALYGLQPDVAGLTLALGNTGDVLVLSDSGGAEQDHVAWEDFEPGWSIAAPIGDSVERSDPTVDTDSASDWQTTSPASPRGGGAGGTYCGDGVCDPGEDCIGCSDDCVGKTGGKPANRYCCGNGTCEPAGEDTGNCPLDCL